MLPNQDNPIMPPVESEIDGASCFGWAFQPSMIKPFILHVWGDPKKSRNTKSGA
jgi:hypothetical protein